MSFLQLWFGITERMEESMCLFHYVTQSPWFTTPTHRRFAHCRPTRFWNEEDTALFQSRQKLDYVVHRVGNAILDLKLHKMREDLWNRIIQQKATLESMPFTTAECLGPRPDGM